MRFGIFYYWGMINPFEAAQVAKGLAREAGFDLVGVAPVEPSAYGEAYQAWIDAGKHGAMDYLARGIEERVDLRKKFPWAKSVVCVALAYYQDAPAAEGPEMGKVARYAWGRDYH